MTATPARIGFILEPVRIATAESAVAASSYGNSARRDVEPVPVLFDEVDDAQLVADERLALLSAARRRFDEEVQGLEEVLALPRAATARVTDDQASLDALMLVSNVELDFGRQVATLEVWG